jgi:septal ring factor EnvC (AmiA/AmiB activator)
MAFFAGTGSAWSAGVGVERNRQRQAAEDQRSELQQKLTTLKRLIDTTETTKTQVADALAQSETAISEANRSLRDLSAEQRATQQRVARLTAQLHTLQTALAARQQQLSLLLREQYVMGNEDRIKLLLSGDDPTRINRSQRYMGYVSRAQAQLIENLRVNMKAIEENHAAAQEASNDLNDIAAESRSQSERLEVQKKQRTRLLAQIGSQLARQRTEAGLMERDDNRLGKVVDQLSKLIAQQQAAEAAAQARRRLQLEAAKAQREQKKERDKALLAAARAARMAASKNGNTGVTRPPGDAIDNDQAPKAAPLGTAMSRDNDNSSEIASQKPSSRDVGSTTESTSQESSESQLNLPLFSSLKGRLTLPVKGELTARFGAKRGDGPNWKGIFIRAAEGTQIHAIAAGRVVFAEWLRGFGNLIIVDHGTQYMSIYGNNQAVLKHAGDRVESGEVIAAAGNTGGNEQSGLYFEMRYQGRAFDPLAWVTTR